MAVSVLHISHSDARGGSQRSAYRLHESLRRLGAPSRMLVGMKFTADEDVRPLKRNVAWRALDRPFNEITQRLDLQYVFMPSSFAVAADPWFREADVVQLFNTHGSYFAHTALPYLSRRRPVVWRLSDMWPFTGHVAYSLDCDRWRLGCGSCPYLDEYPALKRDTSALLWRIKRAVYSRSRLTVVAPSRWMARLARESPLFGQFPVKHVPNGVDLDVFRPVPKEEARHALGLDPARPLVLFAALRLDERRKGGAELGDALRRVDDVDFDVLTVGANPPDLSRRTIPLGQIEDDPKLALAYSAADIFVLPALAENLPNTAIESLACATPCVAFSVGGVPDVVRHLETGFLAAPGDVDGLAAGIRKLLQDDDLRHRLAAKAREIAEREFSREREARGYVALYEEIVAER